MGNQPERARGVPVGDCIEEISLCLPAAHSDDCSYCFLTDLPIVTFDIARQLVKLASELMQITAHGGLEELDSWFSDRYPELTGYPMGDPSGNPVAGER